MTSTALITQKTIAFVSEHLSTTSVINPTTTEGKLVHDLFEKREQQYAAVSALGAALDPVLSSASHITGYFGLTIHSGIPGTPEYNPGTLEHALLRMDCAHWQMFFNRSELIGMLPSRMADDFKAKIATRDVPAFTPEFVLPTLHSWMSSQHQFIAERVDGVFHALSPDHITNSPAGFGKKMILKNAVGLKEKSSVSRIIDDLRVVIASLQGNHTWLKPGELATRRILTDLYARRMFDTDIELDGGALVCRIFKVGTIHLFIHPDIAYKLNDILAMLYPQAIPAKFRKQPAVREQFFKPTINQTLPPSLIGPMGEALSKTLPVKSRDAFEYRMELQNKINYDTDRFFVKVPFSVVQHALWEPLRDALGLRDLQVPSDECHLHVSSYDTRAVAIELLQHGSFPDKVSHQFYASKGRVAEDAAEWLLASDAPGLTYLEPSAGQADLLRLLPTGTRATTAVELSSFNVAIARAIVPNAKILAENFIDFAERAQKQRTTFDRVLMNPPYSNGQALHHTRLAASLLPVGGVLVAILPSSLKDVQFPGFTVEQSKDYANAFDDANVTVFLLKLTKQPD